MFRAQFHAMCGHVGVDPLVSNQSTWAQLLGLGDFYYQLGVQVIEACLATRCAALHWPSFSFAGGSLGPSPRLSRRSSC